jgi:cell division protein FtsB
VVLCAIALSLAYPIREYLAQRRQIDELLAQRAAIAAHLRQLHRETSELKTPSYIERQARDRLHMCFPSQVCYVILDPAGRTGKNIKAGQAATPWYDRLWTSVQHADVSPAKARHG